MKFADNIADKFMQITGYDVVPFFIVSNSVLSRFARNSDNLNILLVPKVKAVLMQLKSSIDDINSKYWIYRQQLCNDLRFFEMIENIDTIDNAINTMLNAPKWGKYFKNSLRENQIPEMEYVIKQNETLEQIALEVLNSDNFLNDWFDIALNNDLEEEDYTYEGGTTLKLPLHIAGLQRMDIDSIVDLIDEETIKGKDIHRNFEFVDNDIKNITGLKCALQTVDILSGLIKGDNPDFPEHGMSKSFMVGVSTAFLNYPIIVRQMISNFNNDDSLTSFGINSFKQEQDNLTIDFQVSTRTNEIINRQLEI